MLKCMARCSGALSHNHPNPLPTLPLPHDHVPNTTPPPQVFTSFDTDGDGVLGGQELLALLQGLV
jgi:hypothetical protein